MENSSLINALAIKYLNVYEIDIESRTAKIIKLEGYITEGILEDKEAFDYETMLKRYASSRIYKDDYHDFITYLSIDHIKEKLSEVKTFDFSYRVVDDDNSVHHYTATYSVCSEKGEPLKVVCGFRIIDKVVKNLERKFFEGLTKAYKALASIYASMFRVDLTNNSYYVITATDDVSYSISKQIGNYLLDMPKVIDETCSTPFKKMLFDFLDADTLDQRLNGKSNISIEFISKNHGWCKGIIMKEESIDNKITSFIFAIEIIELNKQRENALAESAHTDMLTGIYNRGYGEACVEEAIKKSDFGFFAILDCDHFKSINDRYGHQVGDKVIISIARALENVAKDNDIVFRLGGDEFAIYSPNIKDEEAVSRLFNKIIEHIKKIKIDGINNDFVLSLGGTFYTGISDSFSKLYKKADDAMYESKKYEGFKATIK